MQIFEKLAELVDPPLALALLTLLLFAAFVLVGFLVRSRPTRPRE